jgi:hypothetical protein
MARLAANGALDMIQLVTFSVPGSSVEPMPVKVAHSGLRMVLVSRESVRLLDESWKVLGIYFLLGASDDPDRYRAYVGEVGKRTLIQRIKQHAGEKDWWSRALLIASASDDFNSAEIGWLEGRLYDVLNNAVACDVMNGNRPGDNSLSVGERSVLERYVEPVMAALRACGVSLDTADQKPEIKGRKKPVRYSESVSDLIEAGLLKPETILQPLRKGVTGTACVLADGRLQVDGSLYDSLSGAAKAATGTVAEAGWDFWGAPSGAGGFIPLAQLRARLREDSASTGATAPVPTTSEPVQRPVPASAAGTEHASTAPTLATLAEIAAVRPDLFPLSLFANYHGERIEAMVEPSGQIRFGEKTYASPSTAANAARSTGGFAGTGRVTTNGWNFWRYTDTAGTAKKLGTLRSGEE